MHYIQLAILNQLSLQGAQRFSAFQSLKLTSDHLNFHLQQLQRQKLVVKSSEGYSLTAVGAEYAGRLDKKTTREIATAKVSVSLGIMRENDNKVEFLLSERLVGQSKGQIAWHTAKILLGEPFQEAAARCLLNETGLSGEFTYQGVNRIVRTSEDQIEIDVVVMCFKATNVTGELIPETEQVRNFWISAEDAKELTNTVIGFQADLQAYLDNKQIFAEYLD